MSNAKFLFRSIILIPSFTSGLKNYFKCAQLEKISSFLVYE